MPSCKRRGGDLPSWRRCLSRRMRAHTPTLASPRSWSSRSVGEAFAAASVCCRAEQASSTGGSRGIRLILDDASALPTLPKTGREPIYVGLSSDLARREFETHFQSRKTRFSTLRRSLGAFLNTELNLRARPRGTGASATNYRCYRFDDAGKDKLSGWMRDHLRVAAEEYGNPEAIERELDCACLPTAQSQRMGPPRRGGDQGVAQGLL